MSADAPATHPPKARPAGAGLPLAALAAGPAGWALQLVLGYGLSSYACFPRDTPALRSPPPGWSGEPGLLLAINLLCLALVLAGLTASAILWRRDPGRTLGDAGRAAGGGVGRTRFLAACGVISGLVFAVAVLFDTVSILGTSTCWSIAP
jgi:hypothetical protein